MRQRPIAACALILLAAAALSACSKQGGTPTPASGTSTPAPAAAAPAPTPNEPAPATPPEDSPPATGEPARTEFGPLSEETIASLRAGQADWATALPTPAEAFRALENAFGDNPAAAWASCSTGETVPADESRAKTALLAGSRVACFFAAVWAKDAARARTLLDQLLVLAERLGVVEAARAQSADMIRAIESADWDGLREKVDKLYETVRSELEEGKSDEETAMLVTLGAWLKGMGVVAQWVVGNHTDDRAAILRAGFIPLYFQERLGALQGTLAQAPAVRAVATELALLTTAMTLPREQAFDVARTKQVSEATQRALASFEN